MSNLLLLLPVALVLLCVSVGETSPTGCCTNLSLRPLPLDKLKDFRIQDATKICRLNAVIFNTVKNRKICANPDDAWVKHAVQYLSNKKKQSMLSKAAV